jgi:CotH protein/concanavalin A-like lectin/glucanase superfamily protein/lamin tail-like protein/Fn3 domain-containing protein/chitobiase/beta-hexosaminidase-like protein
MDVIINEFLAGNGSGLLDEDGEASDWIEIQNRGPEVDLAGWALTDDPDLPFKWRFPSTPLPSGGYLLVFASGKDRARAGSQLHTNFKLEQAGEFLALVKPDGTPAQMFSPKYPPQRTDVSYGVALERSAMLVSSGAEARTLVPADDSLGLSWTGGAAAGPFDDSQAAGWIHGPTGIGYDVGSSEIRPIAFYDFDDDSDPNVALDSSGGESHGIISSHFELTGNGGSSRPRYTGDGGGHSGAAGDRALDFGLQGDGALVMVPAAARGLFDTATAHDAITLSLWIFGSPAQPADDSVFWGSSNPDGTGIRSLNAHIPWSDGTIYWDTSGCCDGTQRIQKHESDPGHYRGRWNHYAFVKDKDRKQIWQNGALFHEGTNTADLTMIRGFTIGNAENNGELSYGGLIDDFAVWDQALTASEIARIAQGDSPLALSSFRPLIGTDVHDAMRGKGGSVYIRIPFTVETIEDRNVLVLRMRYDAGFVAYLNGAEVARRNAPADLGHDSQATAARPARVAATVEEIDISGSIGHLQPGPNLLAIHGLNDARDSPNFLIVPELAAARASPGRFLIPPTPGTSNAEGVLGFVERPVLSVQHGLFQSTFEVEVAAAGDGTEVYTTTDGSEPGPKNLAARRVEGPLAIAGTTTLRAAAFRDGFAPSEVVTASYLFPAAVARQPAFPPGLPRTWGGYPADYEVDPEVVNNTLPGYGFEDALRSIPTVSLVLDPADLFGAEGIYSNSLEDWERAGSIELIDTDGGAGFQTDAGVRIHGYTSRDSNFTPKHSFRVLWKSRYGPSKLHYRLFPDTDVDQFDQVVLRGMSTDSWPVTDGWLHPDGSPRWFRERAQYLREQWMKDSQRAMGNLSTHGIFVHLFLNGLYWGLYNLTERATDSFNAEHLGGEKEEYDVLKDFAEVQAGNGDAWNQMMALASAGLAANAAYERLSGNNPDGTRNPAIPRLLDLDNLIDYMILHITAGADDWPDHNWWAGRRRGPQSEGFKFFAWDQEITNESLTRTTTSWGPRFEDVSAYNSPAYLYAQLKASARFRRRFADRVQKHLFGRGALTPDASRARWQARADEVDRAIVGESARWGDAKRAVPYRREVEWLEEQRWIQDVYWKGIQPIAVERFKRVGLYPEVAAPVLNRFGGRISAGFELTLSAPAGKIYYTLDGPDPQLESGAVAPSALPASGAAIPLDRPTTVRARALDAGQWSALVEASFFIDVPLRITEIMYHPAHPPAGDLTPDEEFEFVELQNVGREVLDLRGLHLAGAVEFEFASGSITRLAPGRMVVVARNLEAFKSRYGAIETAGIYSGELKNSQGTLRLVGPSGENLLEVRYSDAWYPETDGSGPSLVIRDALGDPESWGERASWRASARPGGSPGADESGGPPASGFRLGGDSNQDGALDLSDPIGLLALLFLGSSLEPPCPGEIESEGNLAVLDANGDGVVDLSDPIWLLGYLFLGGPPHARGPDCAPVAGCSDACPPTTID